MKLEIYP